MRVLLFSCLMVFVFGCKTKQQAAGQDCGEFGIVKDFGDLDGCGLLIELDNGVLLNPAKMAGGFKLKEGQRINFSYKKLPDMASSCMAEKAIVEITCIQEVNDGTSGNNDCVDTENPFAVDWMDKAIDIHNPNQIIKYKKGDGWAYLFRGIPMSFLYDCRGKLICETRSNHDECYEEYLAKFGKGKIIWQGEGIWD
ncbi:MAG: hypothetical protein KDD27_24730 [Saprospiraceae bacterium]|nr:hypothetical protein [Saprospiraceae bacterium]